MKNFLLLVLIITMFMNCAKDEPLEPSNIIPQVEDTTSNDTIITDTIILDTIPHLDSCSLWSYRRYDSLIVEPYNSPVSRYINDTILCPDIEPRCINRTWFDTAYVENGHIIHYYYTKY